MPPDGPAALYLYDALPVKTDDAEIVANITAICDELTPSNRRFVLSSVSGMVVNSKKIRRLMREHDLQPKRRRRFVATTDSDHDNPIFPARPRQDRRRPEPALGGGYHLYRDRNGVRLSGRNS